MNDEEKLIELLDSISRSTANQVVETSNKKNLKYQPATVVGYDENTYKATVYFGNNPDQLFTFYNKSGCKLYEGDNVKIQYTLNPAKGDLVVRCGRTEPINVGGSECEHQKFTSFSANADGTYTYNGITYGFETDADTGYINKIFDDEKIVDISTDNIDVSAGVVDFNTMIMAVAMSNGLQSNINKTEYIFKDGNLNPTYTVSNYQGLTTYKDGRYNATTMGDIDLSELSNGYNVRQQSDGRYFTYDSTNKRFTVSAQGSTILAIPLKPITSAKAMTVNFAATSNSDYYRISCYLCVVVDGHITSFSEVKIGTNAGDTTPCEKTSTVQLTEGMTYNALMFYAAGCTAWVGDIKIEY